jgi:hypothetical protein
MHNSLYLLSPLLCCWKSRMRLSAYSGACQCGCLGVQGSLLKYFPYESSYAHECGFSDPLQSSVVECLPTTMPWTVGITRGFTRGRQDKRPATHVPTYVHRLQSILTYEYRNSFSFVFHQQQYLQSVDHGTGTGSQSIFTAATLSRSRDMTCDDM